MTELHILLGPEEGEKNEYIKKLKKDTLKKYSDCEVYSFFVGDDEENAYINAVSQPSLFASHRFITLKNFEEIKKTDKIYSATLDAATTDQSDLTLVIASKDTVQKNIEQALLSVSGNNTIVFWEMKEEQKRAWIQTRVRKEGFFITSDAIEEILNSVENNTEEMKNLVIAVTNFLRLKKTDEKTITLDTIESYSTYSKGENGYSLFKALGEKNLERALQIVDSLITNNSSDIIPAIKVCANQYRKLEEALKMKKRGMREDEIFREIKSFSLYSSVQRVGIYTLKEKELFRAAMKNYNIEEVKRIIIRLGEADKEVKTATGDLLKISMENVIYSILVNGGKDSELSLECLEI